MHDKYLGLTPPMGWNSWNTFNTGIDEAVVRESAEAMVKTGLKDAGYEYVVIDDCWSLHDRDENGRLVADPEKFPSGMKALADYIHSLGLKFGMYSCDGPFTCARYPGSFDHEFVDAETFSDWGVDYLKYDNCFKPKIDGNILYRRMALALRAQKRDIMFSACNWGAEDSEHWMNSTGAQLYRSTGDIQDTWESIKRLALSQITKRQYAGPFFHNDIDMLVVGMFNKSNNSFIAKGENPMLTDLEYRTHFAYWCYMNSPLMIGCDIRDMTEETKKTLTNKDLIAINQDIECRAPFCLNANPEEPGEVIRLVKTLSNGDLAIGLFNFADKKRPMQIPLFDIGLPITTGKQLEVYDCVYQESLGNIKEIININVEPHDCKVLRCKVIDL